ncbi:MAG TPA: hypothetical protein VLG50_07985 [Candidatus Saccharimonadales bacterium]|nr:hypothetical protein [Candidatus Saccharimonadales bacterium]
MIHLVDILSNNKEVVDEVIKRLRCDGYVFVQLPPVFIKQVDECKKQLQSFLNLPIQKKSMYHVEPIFGYSSFDHKEVFRFMTGTRINEVIWPPSFDAIQQLAFLLDSMVPTIVSTLFDNVVIDNNHIPFKKWAMLDTVYYNNTTTRPNNLNVVEHYDAGLLAFSFLSTEHGLQFKNQSGEWIDSPRDCSIGVIWVGDAIRQYKSDDHAVGIHRVATHHKPRLAMWYEVCTYAQERKDLLNEKFYSYPYELELLKKEGYEPDLADDGSINHFVNTNNNQFIGINAASELTTGSNKVAIGVGAGIKALIENTTGSSKTDIGYKALNRNTGQPNIAYSHFH